MDGLWTALQFFTRIRLVKQVQWDEGVFGRSIPFIPAVGLIVGGLLALANLWLAYLGVADLLRVSLLLVLEIVITGGLLYDGFMDTADGLFSGRERERMLVIMKDSRVGANGVLAAISLVLLKWSLWGSVGAETLSWLLLLSQFVGRIGMVGLICRFPYARQEGIGGLFAKHAKPSYWWLAVAQGLVVLLAVYVPFVAAACLTWAAMYYLATRAARQLGGLTGDVYGALTESGNLLFVLFCYVMLRSGQGPGIASWCSFF